MKLRAVLALVPVSISVALTGTVPPAAARDSGWIRWGNWSPSAPDFDIYLNSFGGSGAPTVIHHVRYGHISAFTGIPPGQYTIAMRKGGTAAAAPPVLSASVHVAAGTGYTIVSMGSPAHLGVQVLTETMASARGKALVRVVQESVQQHRVTVTDGRRALGGPLQLGAYTRFMPVRPGRQTIHAAGFSATATRRVSLAPNSIHTLVVLDKPGGLRISSIQDAVGSHVMPIGGAATGFGGTAPRPASPAPWLVTIAGGMLLTAAGLIRMRQTRHRPAHAAVAAGPAPHRARHDRTPRSVRQSS
jgi:hypothetical protein